MYLGIKTTPKHRYFYVMERTHADGKPKNIVIEALGREDKLRDEHEDPEGWAREHIRQLNERKKQSPGSTIVLKPDAEVQSYKRRVLNIGYLFLQRIYNELHLPALCAAISKRWHLDYNLNSVLSRIIYCRILYPDSWNGLTENADRLLQKKDFDFNGLCRALRLLSGDAEGVQKRLHNSMPAYKSISKDALYCEMTSIFWDYPRQM